MTAATPMMAQYLAIKAQHKDSLLFFRLGDFYEMFFEDAEIGSRELDITLTGRECGQEKRAPMCGIPYHSADSYIARLIEKGYSVAICEQTENPRETKTLVRREVTRVVSPGTIIDANALDMTRNNYIMSVLEDKTGIGVAVCDISTGEFICADLGRNGRLADEIAKYSPSEIICGRSVSDARQIEETFRVRTRLYSEWAFDYGTAEMKLLNHFKVMNLNGFGAELARNPRCVSAAGGLLAYLYETQRNGLSNISKLSLAVPESFLTIDASSRRNLELCESMRDRRRRGSLLWVLDGTKTAMGSRRLRKWIEQPLARADEINARLEAVGELCGKMTSARGLAELFGKVQDIERIVGRIAFAAATARDFVALKSSLGRFPDIKALLGELSSPLIAAIAGDFDELSDIHGLIDAAFVEEPPAGVREGGFVKPGFDAELDKHREAKDSGTAWLLELETRERESSGIKSLKIRYNKVFGYYIEITNSNLASVPERYARKQTLANCERFVTPELKEIEDAILGADEKICEIEYRIFMKLRERVGLQTARILAAAERVSVVDCLVSLAAKALENGYVRPVVDDGGIIELRNSRHPVIEKLTPGGFVPNDAYLDLDESRLLIITGPNMAGKSTYMRQIALIAVMAQMGSFVPADSARIGVCDRVFTRVGASDDLATGQSTFMVEMSEVANIINNATKRSLIVLDEIGRGTSTYDGLSIAWAVLEYIASRKTLGARTLFATHYHELTELEGHIGGVKNYHVTIAEGGGGIIFLHRIAPGGADNSYGIEVAKLAGLPERIINRSETILRSINLSGVQKISGHSSGEAGDEAVMPVIYGRARTNEMSSNHKIILSELDGLDVKNVTLRDAVSLMLDAKSGEPEDTKDSPAKP